MDLSLSSQVTAKVRLTWCKSRAAELQAASSAFQQQIVNHYYQDGEEALSLLRLAVPAFRYSHWQQLRGPAHTLIRLLTEKLQP